MSQDTREKTEPSLVRSSAAEYLTFVAASGQGERSVEMRYQDENIWLTQKLMAALYDVSVAAINQHLKRIFEDGELSADAVIQDYLITAADGKNYKTKHYSLQAIVAVGFKVNNPRAVQFRKWAGQIVKDYTIQGWAMDVERLKKGHMFTDEYFERQLAYIREIRLSERKFYQKVTDLYATAFDYDANARTTREFFALVQNKLHWAKRLDGFLEFNGNEILTGPEKMTSEQAKLHAETEFEKYRIVLDRLFESDYDRFMALQEKTQMLGQTQKDHQS